MATLASACKKQKADHGKKIPVNTFLKWNVQNIFDYETETVEGTSYVIKIKCKMCVKHIDSKASVRVGVQLVPMVTALLLSTVPREVTELQCIRTNQKFHHKFSVFECMKIAQNYAQVSLSLSHTIQYSKMLIFFH